MTKKAYVGGTFDCLHAGHINLINKVIELGFEPVIVVNSDDFVKKYRKKPCLFNEEERVEALKEYFNYFYDVFIVEQNEQRELITGINPDVIVVGTDWMSPNIFKQLDIDEYLLKELDIKMLFIPRFEGISSSEIKKRLKNVASRSK